MNAPVSLRHVWRLGLVYLGLLVILALWGQNYARWLLPLYQAEIHFLAPQYNPAAITLGEQHGEPIFVLNVTTSQSIEIGHHVVPKGVDMASFTLVGQAFQHLLVAISLFLAWPVKRWHDYAVRLLLGFLFLSVVEWLDIPLVLLGSLDDLMLTQWVRHPGSQTLTVYWMNFLNGGGRLALTLAVVFLTLSMHRFLFRDTVHRDVQVASVQKSTKLPKIQGART